MKVHSNIAPSRRTTLRFDKKGVRFSQKCVTIEGYNVNIGGAKLKMLRSVKWVGKVKPRDSSLVRIISLPTWGGFQVRSSGALF